MQAIGLQAGDVFVSVEPEVWAEMTNRQRRDAGSAKVERRPELCTAHRDRIHVRTSAGDWCVPMSSPVTLLSVEEAKRAKQRAKRAA